MYTISDVSFSLGKNGNKPDIEQLIAVAKDWVVDKFPILEPHDYFANKTTGDRFKVTTKLIEMQDFFDYNMVLEHPTSNNKNIMWVTDLNLKGDKNCVYARVQLMNYKKNIKIYFKSPLSRPRLIHNYLSRFDSFEFSSLDDKFYLSESPFSLGNNDVIKFAEFLMSPNRKNPVFFISCSNANDKPIIDADFFANSISGLAHVCVAPDSYFSTDLEIEFEGNNTRIVNNGAVQIFFPQEADRKMLLLMPEVIQDMGEKNFKNRVMRSLAQFSCSRKPVLDFDDKNKKFIAGYEYTK